MINKCTSEPSFGSTFLPINQFKKISELSNILNPYFRIKAFSNNLLKPQEIANTIDYGTIAMVNHNKGILLVGKDGGEGGADTFLGKIIKKAFPDAVFTNDIKPSKTEQNTIDLSI